MDGEATPFDYLIDQGKDRGEVGLLGFSMGGYDFSKRTKTSLRAYQHGAKITADKKLNPRLLIISGILYETEAGVRINTSADFEAEWDELTEQINKETLHIYGYKINRYMIAECLEKSTHEWVAMNHSGNISLSFRVEEPFWWSSSEIQSSQNVTASGQTKNWTVIGKESTYPVARYTAGGNQTIVKLKNQSAGNREVTYTAALANTDYIDIDMSAGTLTKNGTDSITNMTGAFWELRTGVNTIEITITGTAGTSSLRLTYRNRWI